jgi:hypothetical protein
MGGAYYPYSFVPDPQKEQNFRGGETERKKGHSSEVRETGAGVQVSGHGVHHGNIIPACNAFSFFIFESMGDSTVIRFLAVP